MQLEPPDVFGAKAVGNNKGPFPKIYLEDNYGEWLAKIEENHYVIRKEFFNKWSGEYNGKTRTWADVATKLKDDSVMCSVGDDNIVTLKAKGVLAFVIKKSSDQNLSSVYGFWVLKTPKSGFYIRIR